MEKIERSLDQMLGEWIAAKFREAFPDTEIEECLLTVAETIEESFGDYQCNAAMALARTLKLPPRAIAEKLLQMADPLPDFLSKIEIAGPGFVNLFLDQDWLSAYLEAMSSDPRLGVPLCGEGQTVIFDYSSPNVAKPMHIGHIRSTVIGNALDRMHRFLGYKVIADNHLGDWGTQFGLILLGYREYVDQQALLDHPAEELERVYVKSYERSKSDPDWLESARRELVKLQSGDADCRALWEKCVQLSLEEFDHIYKRLGIEFDLTRGESYYNERLPLVVAELREKGLLEESEGAQVVFIDKERSEVCIVQKQDGGYNYTTTDLATVISRIEEFAPDKIVYVTDERQQRHFRHFFEVCKRAGWDANLVHVWFGLMRLPDATFSTREGNVIKLEQLLDMAESKALELVRGSSPDMPADEQRAVARAVGIGSIKYADLSQNPQSLVTFTWDKALALDGNSAPYLQYAHARISSVASKYAERFPGSDLNSYSISIGDPIERRLALKLTRFASTAIRATELYRPNMLADYLYELSQLYSSFYQNLPFLKAEEGLRESRIRLCMLTARVLKKGLSLLGIDAPERI
jgi:arginyl-tRNA synthetase